MADKTSNYELILPEDYSEQWGKYLNQNFQSIDTYLYLNYQIVRSSLNNSGVVNGINKNTNDKPTVYYDEETKTLKINTEFDVYFPNKKVIFTSEDLPGVMSITGYSLTISEIVEALSIEKPQPVAPIYYQFYFGLRFKTVGQAGSYDKIITYNRSDFNIETEEDIYLGSAVIYWNSDKNSFEIANELICFKPWFSKTNSDDRAKFMNTMGEFTSGKIKIKGNTLEINEQFSWIYEGIKYWSARNQNFIDSFVQTKTDESGRPTNTILFFYACGDGKISGEAGHNELDFNNTEIQSNHYCYYEDGSWKHGEVPTGKYTIQRYGIIENLKSVVFYGDKIYDTYSQARAAISQLEPINTTIPVKEVARIIVQSQEGVANIPEDDLFNLEDIQISMLPKGGSAGDVLMKVDEKDGNVTWGKPTVENFAIYWKEIDA